MAITCSQIETKLREKLQAIHVEVKDISGGCGQSFEVIVVSDQFNGKPLLQRHRMVNECLSEELSVIHALTQRTYTPEQWKGLSPS